MTVSPNRFALNACENALDYLRRAEGFISEAKHNPIAWKWVTIALHGALYGFAISGCPDRMTWITDEERRQRLSVNEFIKKRLAEEANFTRRELNNEAIDPFRPENARLISIKWAIEICLQQPGRPRPGGKPYALTDNQQKAVDQLTDEYRNRFEHFHFERLIVPGNELPTVARGTLEAIRLFAGFGLLDNEMVELENIVSRCENLLAPTTPVKTLG